SFLRMRSNLRSHTRSAAHDLAATDVRIYPAGRAVLSAALPVLLLSLALPRRESRQLSRARGRDALQSGATRLSADLPVALAGAADRDLLAGRAVRTRPGDELRRHILLLLHVDGGRDAVSGCVGVAGVEVSGVGTTGEDHAARGKAR